nr:ubiquitin-specific protease 13 [Tanacetum cinerariifolium]
MHQKLYSPFPYDAQDPSKSHSSSRTPDASSILRRISKEVVKLEGAPVKSNVGKRKRLVEDKEVEADVEGNESEEADESEKNNESEEAEEIEEDKESEVAREVVKDVKIKVVKGNKKVVLSKSKKRNKEVEAEVEGNKVKLMKVKRTIKVKSLRKVKRIRRMKWLRRQRSRSMFLILLKKRRSRKPKKVYKKKKQVSESSSSYEDERPLKIKKKRSKKKSKKPLFAEQIKKIKYLDDLPGMRSRTMPSSLFAVIRDSQVDMESFLSDIRFSSLHNV